MFISHPNIQYLSEKSAAEEVIFHAGCYMGNTKVWIRKRDGCSMSCGSGVPVHCHVQTLCIPKRGKKHKGSIAHLPRASHDACARHLVRLRDPKGDVVHVALDNPAKLKHELLAAVLPVGDHHVTIPSDDTALRKSTQPPTRPVPTHLWWIWRESKASFRRVATIIDLGFREGENDHYHLVGSRCVGSWSGCRSRCGVLGVELVVLGQVDRAFAHRPVFFCWAVLPGEEN